MIKSNRGQALIEALFVIVFTTVIMFAFLQTCIMVVDDMIANEAAFVGMRSAAVTKSAFRAKEAEDRIRNYIFYFYPMGTIGMGDVNPSNFVLSNKQNVEKFFNKNAEQSDDEESLDEAAADNKAVTIWSGKKKIKDFSGNNIMKQTVKLYYFTRVMFGSLTAPNTSQKDMFFSGSRRYQSARNRMVASPDGNYYYKAYPNAKKFDD